MEEIKKRYMESCKREAELRGKKNKLEYMRDLLKEKHESLQQDISTLKALTNGK